MPLFFFSQAIFVDYYSIAFLFWPKHKKRWNETYDATVKIRFLSSIPIYFQQQTEKMCLLLQPSNFFSLITSCTFCLKALIAHKVKDLQYFIGGTAGAVRHRRVVQPPGLLPPPHQWYFCQKYLSFNFYCSVFAPHLHIGVRSVNLIPQPQL